MNDLITANDSKT
jgi:DNA repair exonuclease SbcCD ATPase subunit